MSDLGSMFDGEGLDLDGIETVSAGTPAGVSWDVLPRDDAGRWEPAMEDGFGRLVVWEDAG